VPGRAQPALDVGGVPGRAQPALDVGGVPGRAQPALPMGAAAAAGGHDDDALAAQLRSTFGPTAADVTITPDSTQPLAAGAEGVTIDEKVFLAPGRYDLGSTAGKERIGHEVAHVVQQRRGRDLRAPLAAGERAHLEAEADRAGSAFARGERFVVQGRAPTRAALFKGAAPAPAAAATTTTTTIDLKATGGKIERKPPAPAADPAAAPAGGAAAAAPAAPAAAAPKEKLVVSYGEYQASNPFMLERDESGAVKRLVGHGAIRLPKSTYIDQLDLQVALGADGTVGAKVQASATQEVKLGGLQVRGGTLVAAIENGALTYSLDGATILLPKNLGEGSLSLQGSNPTAPEFDASLTINVPKLQPSTMTFHANESGYQASGSTGVDIKNVSGTVTFTLEKVGDDKALWSAAGSVGYSSERLSGQVSIQYNADGELSGEGELDFKIADFLTGRASVAIDKEGHVTVEGEIRPPNETQLFPEKKVEQTFFHKSVDIPLWGISIPAVGSIGIIAFIEGSMGYRVGVGAGVMRDIVLSGSYSTDPSVEPAFQISGEIFIPAFAELLISIGGGVKLDAFLAEIGGGVKVDGRAGFYGGLSVKPSLAYEGGKYRLAGKAVLGGDVGLSAQVDAFVKLHVGKWFLSWEKEWDWKLGEWNKWLGLNLGMEADLDYTLGQPLSPDIFKLKKPDSIDVQDIAKSAMPQAECRPKAPKARRMKRTSSRRRAAAAQPPGSRRRRSRKWRAHRREPRGTRTRTPRARTRSRPRRPSRAQARRSPPRRRPARRPRTRASRPSRSSTPRRSSSASACMERRTSSSCSSGPAAMPTWRPSASGCRSRSATPSPS
jgi:uncharacterized protein DUF4157